MAQTINTNVISLNAQRNANNTQSTLATAMQRLSSGLRVNSAKDDAAGMAIAERMNTQFKGMNVAIRNANDAISLAQTAEGALGKVSDMLQRMRELAVQSANGTNNTGDRAALNNEFSQLQSEIDRVVSNTKFNGTNLLTATTAFTFQIGANTSSTGDRISVNGIALSSTVSSGGSNEGALAAVYSSAITNISAVGTAGSGADFNAYTQGGAGALDAMAKIDFAISQVNLARSTFGAAQNRFEAVISTLEVAAENQAAARGRIMDADFAAETATLSRSQILQQAGTAMISQANQLPQNVLGLLR